MDIARAVESVDKAYILALRRELQAEERVSFHDAPEGVLHLERPGGWHSVTNFTDDPVPLPDGEVLLSSARGDEQGTSGTDSSPLLPGNTTVWLRAWIASARVPDSNGTLAMLALLGL